MTRSTGDYFTGQTAQLRTNQLEYDDDKTRTNMKTNRFPLIPILRRCCRTHPERLQVSDGRRNQPNSRVCSAMKKKTTTTSVN